MNKSNKNITFKGGKVTVRGTDLQVGDALPSFKLTGTDMKDVTSDAYRGKKFIVVAVPSIDTPVCQKEVKRFNDELAQHKDISVLVVSVDLPFAQKRWCGAEGIANLTVASDYKYRNFGDAFGVYIEELGLLARAIFVVNQKGILTHIEYVGEIAEEPDYTAAFNAVKS